MRSSASSTTLLLVPVAPLRLRPQPVLLTPGLMVLGVWVLLGEGALPITVPLVARLRAEALILGHAGRTLFVPTRMVEEEMAADLLLDCLVGPGALVCSEARAVGTEDRAGLEDQAHARGL